MRARHICAVLGIAAAAGAVVFTQSLVATNDAQAVAIAERLIKAVPVDADARTVQLQLDFRPDGRVLQGPPMMAYAATRPGLDGALVTKALFAQRRVKNLPAIGEELTLVGRKGAYRVKLAGYLAWERPARGSPNMFLPPSAVAEIDEEWQDFKPVSAEELSPMFLSDAGRNMDRAKPLLLWAAALTALCLLVNTLFLTIESRRMEIATLRILGMTRGGVAKMVVREALALVAAGLALGIVGAIAVLFAYVACDAETFLGCRDRHEGRNCRHSGRACRRSIRCALRPKAGVRRKAARGRVRPRSAQEAARHDYRVRVRLRRVCRSGDLGHIAHKAVHTFARVARRDSFDTPWRRFEL